VQAGQVERKEKQKQISSNCSEPTTTVEQSARKNNTKVKQSTHKNPIHIQLVEVGRKVETINTNIIKVVHWWCCILKN